MPADRIAAELLALLEEEREALCTARPDLAAALGERKLALVARLERQAPGPSVLAPLRGAARRNARLLAAALAGLREGAGRLQAIRAGAAGFDSYDRAGRADHVAGHGSGPGSGTVERRA